MRIALTGATGHIGNNICRALLGQGHQLKVLIRSNQPSLKGLDVETVTGDLFNSSSLLQLTNKVDYLIHLAAFITINPRHYKKAMNINVDGPKNIVEACLESGVANIIHFSSIHAHQLKHRDQVIDENSPFVDRRNAGYDYSKVMGESIMVEARKSGINTVIVNPTAVLGPYDFKPSLAGTMLMDMYNGNLPFITPYGFDWVDARDISNAVVAIIDRDIKNEKFILSGHYETIRSLGEKTASYADRKYKGFTLPFWLAYAGVPFIRLFSDISGKEPLYTASSLSTVRTGSTKISHQKASDILGFKPREIDITLSDTLDWFLENGYIKSKNK